MAGVGKFICFVSLVMVVFSQDQCGNIDSCSCSDELHIFCSGQEFTNIEDIYPYVTKFTQGISIIGGKLESVKADLFGLVTDRLGVDNLDQLTFLNLSGNGIKQIEAGAFDLLPKLVTLDLSDNVIQIDRCDEQNAVTQTLAPLTMLTKLHLRGALCTDSTANCDAGQVFGKLDMNSLEMLDLSYNGLSMTGTKFETLIENAPSLTHLNLSHNNFMHFVYGLGFGNIVDYDFSYNKMEFLTAMETDEIEAMPRLTSMRLGGNPFHCDCRMNDAYDWFNSTDRPIDFDDIICQYSENDSNVGKPFMSLKLNDFCGEPKLVICEGPYGPIAVAKSSAWVIVAAGVALIVITIVSLVLFVRHRRRRRRRNGDSGTTSSRTQHAQRESKNPAYSRMV